MNRIIVIITAIVCIFVSCKEKTPPSEEKEETHAKDEHSEGEQNSVSLTEEQIRTADIGLDTIELKNLKTSIRANGTLTVPNQNKALVTSVNSGVLKSLLIQPGSFVKKGQVLATIMNPDAVGLQEELQRTNAQLGFAEIELQRQTDLVEGNAAPLKNLQRVQTELATLRATRNALTQQLNALGISAASVSKGNIITSIALRAPISGTVSNVTAQIGSPVDASTPIAEIVNNSELHLDLFIFEKDLPKLRPNQVIHFTLTNDPGKEYDAKIFSIGTAFVSETKTIPVHAVVMGNKTGLIEGMNITAVISIGQAVLPAVPTEAIVSYQGQDYIFVQSEKPSEETPGHKDDDHGEGEKHDETAEAEGASSRYFERIPVVKGVTDLGYTEITLLKNISPRTPVITKGAFFVQAKMSDTGGHEH